MLTAILAVVFCTLLYSYFNWTRRHLHKMAAMVPGPTPLPLIGNCLEVLWAPKDLLNIVMKLCDRYPDIFRTWFGPQLVYGIHKPEYLEIVMNKALEKQHFYSFAEPLVGLGLFTAGVELWKKQRRIVMPAFSQRILDNSLPLVREEVGIMTLQMAKFANKGVFDVVDTMEKCTLDMLCRTAMGIESHAQTTESSFYKWMDRLFSIMVARITSPLFYFDLPWSISSIYREGFELVGKFNSVTDKVVKERRKLFQETSSMSVSSKKKAFLDILLEISNSGREDEKMSDVELRDQVNTFMVAGTDTIANACCWLFMLIGMHPEIQEELYEEIVNNISGDETLSYRDLKKLRYTDAVIKETLRLFPPASIMLRNVNEDLKLDENVTLAAGSAVFFTVIHTHRNAKYWPDPLKFDPGRFLDREAMAKRHPFSYIPFSGGPRNCPGTKYAKMVMKYIVAMSVKQFQFHTNHKRVEDVKLRTHIMIRPVDGYQISIEERC